MIDVRIADHKVGTLNGHTQEVWSAVSSGPPQARCSPLAETTTCSTCVTTGAPSALRRPLRRVTPIGSPPGAPIPRTPVRQRRACARPPPRRPLAAVPQVSALQWSLHDKELVSSHGYSHNQLNLLRYPSMVKVAELTGHTARILHIAQSPDGQTVVTASADETVRFWKILSGGDASKKEREGARAAAA